MDPGSSRVAAAPGSKVTPGTGSSSSRWRMAVSLAGCSGYFQGTPSPDSSERMRVSIRPGRNGTSMSGSWASIRSS